MPHHRSRVLLTASPTASRFVSTRRCFSIEGGGDGGSDGGGSGTAAPSLALAIKTGDRLGLIRHEVIAEDGHRLRVYSRNPRGRHGGDASESGGKQKQQQQQQQQQQRSILLLHGRTWSSQPVFDLTVSDEDDEKLSTLQTFTDLGFHTYALDLRGFGEWNARVVGG